MNLERNVLTSLVEDNGREEDSDRRLGPWLVDTHPSALALSVELAQSLASIELYSTSILYWKSRPDPL